MHAGEALGKSFVDSVIQASVHLNEDNQRFESRQMLLSSVMTVACVAPHAYIRVDDPETKYPSRYKCLALSVAWTDEAEDSWRRVGTYQFALLPVESLQLVGKLPEAGWYIYFELNAT